MYLFPLHTPCLYDASFRFGPFGVSVMPIDSPEADRVRLSIKLIYGSGQFAEGVKNAAFATFVLLYYNQVLGLSGTLAGLAIFIALCFDAIPTRLWVPFRTTLSLAGVAATPLCMQQQFRWRFPFTFFSHLRRNSHQVRCLRG